MDLSLSPEATIVPTLGPLTCDNPKHSGSFLPDDAGILVDVSKPTQPDAPVVPVYFEEAGPRARIFFSPHKTKIAIVTCGGVCPGINDVIRAIVMFAYKNNLPWYQLFLATVAKVQASGKPVLVMLSPPLCAVSPTVGRQAALDLDVDPAAIDPALPERITRELARNVGLPQETILDFTPCLGEKTPTGETTYTGVDTHWSVAGNAWVGDLLTETLLARWFGRSSATGPACAPAATPAFEPIPSGLAPPAASQMPLATSIVTGCPGR